MDASATGTERVWITVEETDDDRHRREVERALAAAGLTTRAVAAGTAGSAVQVPEEQLEAALAALEALDDGVV